MKKRGIVAGIIAALIVLDQLVKAYVVQNIALGDEVVIKPSKLLFSDFDCKGISFF